MAISDRITSIEEHIKESYQELEGIGIDTTGVNNNLENIPKLIDGYWETLPKVTGEGTSITLDNTKEGKMKIDLKGNTSQATTTGKNLLPNNGTTGTINGVTFKKNADGSVLVNGTATSNTMYYLLLSSENISISAGNYYISGCPSNGSAETYRLVIGVGDALYGEYGAGRAITISAGILTSYIYITKGATVNNLLYKPMLTSGSTATEYEPYTNGASPNPDYPQDIHVVSGDNSINVVGKNLFTLKNISNATTLGVERTINNSELKLNGTSSGTGRIIDRQTSKITLSAGTYSVLVQKKNGTVTPNGNYTVFYFRKPDGTEITALNINNYQGNYSFKTTLVLSEATELYVEIYCTGTGYVLDNLTLQFQIEKGSTATTYEPYIGNTYPVNLPVENLFEPTTKVDGTDIIMANGSVVLNDDEYTLTATGTDCYFGQVLSSGGSYTDNRGKLINVEGMSEITFTITNTLFKSNFITAYDSSKVSLGYTQFNSNTGTYTLPSSTKYITIRFGLIAVVGNSYSTKVQIEKGSKANSYTPYGTTPIELCKIGDYQDSIKKSTGKNLINFNNLNDVTLKGVTTSYLGSKFKMNGTTNEAGYIIAIGNNLNITIPAGTYTLTFAVESGSNTGVGSGKDTAFYLQKANNATVADRLAVITIGQLNTNNKYSTTFTTNEATPLYLYAYANNSGMTFNNYVIQVQLEEGTQDTSFEPYGTGWYVKKGIGKVVLDGTNISFDSKSGATNNIMYNTTVISDILKPPIGNVRIDTLSNYFESKSANQIYANNIIGIGVNITGTLSCGFTLSSSLTTLELANTWLSTHNTIVYYPLATPTYTEITDSTLISQLNALAKSYTGQTNISQESNDLASLLNATALEEM